MTTCLKCPHCGDAEDFRVLSNFDVECGDCGFTVANIKEQFKANKRTAIQRAAENKAKRVNKDAEQLQEVVTPIDRSNDPNYYLCTYAAMRVNGESMCVEQVMFDGQTAYKDYSEGRYIEKDRVLVVRCIECRSSDFRDNGRNINEYECSCCGKFVTALQAPQNTQPKVS